MTAKRALKAAFGACDGYISKTKRFRAHVQWRIMFSVPSNALFHKQFLIGERRIVHFRLQLTLHSFYRIRSLSLTLQKIITPLRRR